VRDDVGILGDGYCCFLDVTSDHSDDNSGLFAFVYCFRDALFKWILDSSQSKNDKPVLILFWMLILSLFFCELLVADEKGSERTSSELIEIELQKILEILINSLEFSILSHILGAFGQQQVGSPLAINVVLGVNLQNAGHSLPGRTEGNCGYNLV
jgi:hypothetical protein